MMEKFTNENVQKEYKKIKNRFILWGILLLLCISFAALTVYTAKKDNQKASHLNEVIMSSENPTEQKAYMMAETIPFVFATYNKNNKNFYIVSDEQYMYIVYMTEKQFEQLNHDSIQDDPVKLLGITKWIPDDVKELAISSYNEIVDEENQIDASEFESYFGNVYLDLTDQTSGEQFFYQIMALICGVLGFGGIIVTVVQITNFKKGIQKLPIDQIYKINDEMNHPDAFYYKKAHLYLTKNYIVNFAGKFQVIPYNEIIWLYGHEVRRNGIKTEKSIQVMTKDGKAYPLASVDAITKRSTEVYNEIFETIQSKKEDIIVGYTKEAREKAKQLVQKK